MADYTYAIIMLDWEMSLDGGCMMRPHRHYVHAKAIKEYVESTVPIEDEQTCWHSGYIQTIAAVAPV